MSASAWANPSYSYVHNWISDLGSTTQGVFEGRWIDSPLHQVMNAGFAVSGLLFAVGLSTLTRGLPARLRRTASVLTIATAGGYLLLAVFHGSPEAAEDGTLALHFLGAALAIVGANVLAIVLGTSWRKDPAHRSPGRTSVLLGVLGLGAVVVLFATMGSGVPAGLVERVSVYTAMAWQVIVAVHLLPTRGDSTTPTARVHVPALSH